MLSALQDIFHIDSCIVWAFTFSSNRYSWMTGSVCQLNFKIDEQRPHTSKAYISWPIFSWYHLHQFLLNSSPQTSTENLNVRTCKFILNLWPTVRYIMKQEYRGEIVHASSLYQSKGPFFTEFITAYCYPPNQNFSSPDNS